MARSSACCIRCSRAPSGPSRKLARSRIPDEVHDARTLVVLRGRVADVHDGGLLEIGRQDIGDSCEGPAIERVEHLVDEQPAGRVQHDTSEDEAALDVLRELLIPPARAVEQRRKVLESQPR